MNNKESDIFKEAEQPKALKDVFDWIQEIKEILEEHLKSKKWYQKIVQSDKKGATLLLKILKNKERELERFKNDIISKEPFDRLAGLCEMVSIVRDIHNTSDSAPKTSILQGSYFRQNLKKIDTLLTKCKKELVEEIKKKAKDITEYSRDCQAMYNFIRNGEINPEELKVEIRKVERNFEENKVLEKVKKDVLETAKGITDLDHVPMWMMTTEGIISDSFENDSAGKKLMKDEKNGLCKMLPRLQTWDQAPFKHGLKHGEGMVKILMGDALGRTFVRIKIIMSRAPEKSILTSDWFIDVANKLEKLVKSETERIREKFYNEKMKEGLDAKQIERIKQVEKEFVDKLSTKPEKLMTEAEKLDEKVKQMVEKVKNTNGGGTN